MSTYLETFNELRKGIKTKEELKEALRKTHGLIPDKDVFPEEVDEFWDVAFHSAVTVGMTPEEFLEEFKWVEETYVPEFIKENFYLNGYEEIYSEINRIRKSDKTYIIYTTNDFQITEYSPLVSLYCPAYIAYIIRYNIFLYPHAIFLGECSNPENADTMNMSLKKETLFGYVGEDGLKYRNATEDDVKRFLTLYYEPGLFSSQSYAESFNSRADKIENASNMQYLIRNICTLRTPGEKSNSFEIDEFWNTVNSYVLKSETLTLSDFWSAMEPVRIYAEESEMLGEPFIRTVYGKLMKLWTKDTLHVLLLKTPKGDAIMGGEYRGIISPVIAGNIGFQMWMNPGSYLVIRDKDMKVIDAFRNVGGSFKHIAKNAQAKLFN